MRKSEEEKEERPQVNAPLRPAQAPMLESKRKMKEPTTSTEDSSDASSDESAGTSGTQDSTGGSKEEDDAEVVKGRRVLRDKAAKPPTQQVRLFTNENAHLDGPEAANRLRGQALRSRFVQARRVKRLAEEARTPHGHVYKRLVPVAEGEEAPLVAVVNPAGRNPEGRPSLGKGRKEETRK